MVDWIAAEAAIEERILASFRPDLKIKCCRCGETLSIGHRCIKWESPVRNSDDTEQETDTNDRRG